MRAVLTDADLPAKFWRLVALPPDPVPADWPHGEGPDGVDSPCWLWTRRHVRDTYPQFGVGQTTVAAGRVALAFGATSRAPRLTRPEHREYQDGGVIRPECGTPACVRPSHLRRHLSVEGERTIVRLYGRSTYTLADLPKPSSIIPALTRAAKPPRLRPSSPRTPANNQPTTNSGQTDSSSAPAAPALAVIVLVPFPSGSYVAETAWGAFNAATADDAIAGAIRNHPANTGRAAA